MTLNLELYIENCVASLGAFAQSVSCLTGMKSSASFEVNSGINKYVEGILQELKRLPCHAGITLGKTGSVCVRGKARPSYEQQRALCSCGFIISLSSLPPSSASRMGFPQLESISEANRWVFTPLRSFRDLKTS